MKSEEKDIDPCCTRPRLDVNDPFFHKGYQVSWRSEGCVTTSYVKESVNVMMESKTIDQQKKKSTRIAVLLYPCGVPGCSKRFCTLSDCESHYEESHIFQCGICASIFSSNSWLDRHLEEAHDSYFATAVERRKAFYQCWVCGEDFLSVKARLSHLTEEHGYPKWFRFVPQAKQRKSPKLSQNRSLTNSNTTSAREVKDSSILEDGYDNSVMAKASNNPLFCRVLEETQSLSQNKSDEKHRKRRERQALKRSRIPCKFFVSPEGCYRGSRCDFQHNNIGTIPTQPNPDDGNIIEMLSEGIRTLSVPSKISFGRKHR
jgi:hypothetical protein